MSDELNTEQEASQFLGRTAAESTDEPTDAPEKETEAEESPEEVEASAGDPEEEGEAEEKPKLTGAEKRIAELTRKLREAEQVGKTTQAKLKARDADMQAMRSELDTIKSKFETVENPPPGEDAAPEEHQRYWQDRKDAEIRQNQANLAQQQLSHDISTAQSLYDGEDGGPSYDQIATRYAEIINAAETPEFAEIKRKIQSSPNMPLALYKEGKKLWKVEQAQFTQEEETMKEQDAASVATVSSSSRRTADRSDKPSDFEKKMTSRVFGGLTTPEKLAKSRAKYGGQRVLRGE
jgi:hypothetical protein